MGIVRNAPEFSKAPPRVGLVRRAATVETPQNRTHAQRKPVRFVWVAIAGLAIGLAAALAMASEATADLSSAFAQGSQLEKTRQLDELNRLKIRNRRLEALITLLRQRAERRGKY